MIQVGHNMFYELYSPPLPILPPDLEEYLTVRMHSSVFLSVMKTGRDHFFKECKERQGTEGEGKDDE